MKKISVLLLMAVLVSGTLAGCSGTENSVSRDVEISSDAETDSGQGEEGSSETVSFGENIEFEPVTAIENENCTVRITDLEAEADRYMFTVEMENTSADQTFSLSPDVISVEGLIYDPDFSELRIPAMGVSLSLISDAAPGTVESGKYGLIRMCSRKLVSQTLQKCSICRINRISHLPSGWTRIP